MTEINKHIERAFGYACYKLQGCPGMSSLTNNCKGCKYEVDKDLGRDHCWKRYFMESTVDQSKVKFIPTASEQTKKLED